jgi:hypothetical protein
MEGAEVITSRYGALKRKAENFSKSCPTKNHHLLVGFSFMGTLIVCFT